MPNTIRIAIVTQEDPFFLGEALAYLLSLLPEEIEIACAVVLPGSPFGRRMSFQKKIFRTLSVFGLRFFVHYLRDFLSYQAHPSRSVKRVFRAGGTPVIDGMASINSDEAIRRIQSYQPDLLVSIGGNQIFGKKLIAAAPRGMLNLHTALLPQYRGLMPTFWVLKNEEQETGVSVFFVDEGIDSGDILVQRRVAIQGQAQAELIRTTKRVGMEALVEAILAVKRGTVTRRPNPADQSTYYPFPTRQDVKEFYRRGKRFF